MKLLKRLLIDNRKMSEQRDEGIENKLEDISKSGQKHVVSANIYSDEDIRGFLYYSSKLLKTPELNIELQYLINHPGSSKLVDAPPSVFDYETVSEHKILLAAWYSGEKEEDAFRKTETRYIMNEEKQINGIVAFKDEKISKDDFLYILVSGRFASKDENSLPIYWSLKRVHSKSLRDIVLYILEDESLKILGIDLNSNTV